MRTHNAGLFTIRHNHRPAFHASPCYVHRNKALADLCFVAHARDHLLADIASLCETNPVELVEIGLMWKNLAGAEILPALGHSKLHAMQVINAFINLPGAATGNELALFADEFFDLGYTVKTATDDGSLGHHGFVTDLLEPILGDIERVYTCGPFPMMGIVAARAQAAEVQCIVSMETHMACGLGACLGCTLPGADGKYIHVCRQGPVFDSKEVAWTL